MSKVVLVVGHEEEKPGAYNTSYGVTEYAFNRKLVGNLQDELSRLYGIEWVDRKKSRDDVTVVTVYRDKIGYAALPKHINKYDPDYVISFHANAFNRKASGSEVLYYSSSPKGKALASLFQNTVLNTLGLHDRGLKARSSGRGSHLLKRTKAPAIILEPFFIDNDRDLERVIDRYSLFVSGLVYTILKLGFDGV